MTQWSQGPDDQHRYGPPVPPSPRPRGRAGVAVVAAVVAFVVVLGLGAGAWLLWQRVGASEAWEGESGPDVLATGPLTAEDLAEVDPAALFYASFKKTVTQPVMHTTQETYYDREELRKRTPSRIWETGFDYRTKQWRMASGPPDPDAVLAVCVDGKHHLYNPTRERWSAHPSRDDECEVGRAYQYITDGISAGGLTEAQADRWIRELRTEYKGLIKPARPVMAEVKGRQYIRQVVDFKPVKRIDDRYYGSQLLMWSFRTTGLNPQTHPYEHLGESGSGFHVIYYLDPESLLPVYSEIEQTPPLDENGEPRRMLDSSVVRTQYHLPGKMPPIKASGRLVRPEITWPRDQG